MGSGASSDVSVLGSRPHVNVPYGGVLSDVSRFCLHTSSCHKVLVNPN